MAVALSSGQRGESAGAVLATTDSTVVTGGAANTKGNYSQLIAATTFPFNGVIVQINSGSAADDYLVDIAIGAAASEQVIIPNIGWSQGNLFPLMAYFPVYVPAGVRLSARCQSVTGSDTITVSVVGIGGGVLANSLQQVTAYGVNTADSGGVSVDPGGTAHTKGAYSEITASTTAPIKHLVVQFGCGNNFTRVNNTWLVDLAIGAGSSEQIIVPDMEIRATGSNIAPKTIGFPYDIPSGTRIAMRASCSVNTAGTRLFDGFVYGVG